MAIQICPVNISFDPLDQYTTLKISPKIPGSPPDINCNIIEVCNIQGNYFMAANPNLNYQQPVELDTSTNEIPTTYTIFDEKTGTYNHQPMYNQQTTGLNTQLQDLSEVGNQPQPVINTKIQDSSEMGNQPQPVINNKSQPNPVSYNLDTIINKKN